VPHSTGNGASFLHIAVASCAAVHTMLGITLGSTCMPAPVHSNWICRCRPYCMRVLEMRSSRAIGIVFSCCVCHVLRGCDSTPKPAHSHWLVYGFVGAEPIACASKALQGRALGIALLLCINCLCACIMHSCFAPCRVLRCPHLAPLPLHHSRNAHTVLQPQSMCSTQPGSAAAMGHMCVT
jgi:hypothetical protein